MTHSFNSLVTISIRVVVAKSVESENSGVYGTLYVDKVSIQCIPSTSGQVEAGLSKLITGLMLQDGLSHQSDDWSSWVGLNNDFSSLHCGIASSISGAVSYHVLSFCLSVHRGDPNLLGKTIFTK